MFTGKQPRHPQKMPMSPANVNTDFIAPALCLPTELFALIFSHLNLKNLGHARQVCHLWENQATPLAWKEMSLTLCTRKFRTPSLPRILPNFRYTTVLSLNLTVDAWPWEPWSSRTNRFAIHVRPDGVDLVNKRLNQLREIIQFLPERMKLLDLSFHTYEGVTGTIFFADRLYRLFETIRDTLEKLTNPDTRKIDKVKVFFMGNWSRMYGQVNMSDLLLILKKSITHMDLEVNSLGLDCLAGTPPTLKEVTLRDSPSPSGLISNETWKEVSWSLDKLTLKYNHSIIPSFPKLADTLTELNIHQKKFSWNAFKMGFFQFSNLEHLRIHISEERENPPAPHLPAPPFLPKPLISTKLSSVTIYTSSPDQIPCKFYQYLREQCPQLSTLTFCTHRFRGYRRYGLQKKIRFRRRGFYDYFEAGLLLLIGGRWPGNGFGPLGCFLRESGASNSIGYIFWDNPSRARKEEAVNIWELKLTKRRPVHRERFFKAIIERDSKISLALCEGWKVRDEVKIWQIGGETWDDLSDATKLNGFWELRLVDEAELEGGNKTRR